MEKCGVAFIALLSICPLVAQNAASKAPSAAPEIFLIGSVHNMHFEERYHYSLIDLQAQVRSLHPDVICSEITPEAFAIVERLQPYNGGNGPAQLGCIEKLANIDKHHHFHVVVTQAYQTEHVRSRIIDSEMIHRLQDGAEIKPTLHDPAELQDAVYVQRGITGTFISFDEGALPQELADLSIDDVLGVCIEAVDRIVIPKFEGLLG